MAKDLTASAHVTLTLEFGGNGPYGEDWTIGKIEEDAVRGTQQQLNRLLTLARDNHIDVRFAGGPAKVHTVITKRGES